MIYNNNNKMSLVVIYNRNQRTASSRGFAFLCHYLFTGDTITGGLRNHREGLLRRFVSHRCVKFLNSTLPLWITH